MEKRVEYLRKLEANIIAYNEKLDEMKVKVSGIKADMKEDYLAKVKSLEGKRDDFVVKYGQLKDSSGYAWLDVKAGSEKAWIELESSFEKAVMFLIHGE